MTEQAAITEEYIQERIEKYLIENKKEVDEFIDKKIKTAVKSVINEKFTDRYKEKSFAAEIICGRVEDLVRESVETAEIDKEEIVEKTHKKVKQEVNKLVKNIGYMEEKQSRRF